MASFWVALSALFLFPERMARVWLAGMAGVAEFLSNGDSARPQDDAMEGAAGGREDLECILLNLRSVSVHLPHVEPTIGRIAPDPILGVKWVCRDERRRCSGRGSSWKMCMGPLGGPEDEVSSSSSCGGGREMASRP